MRVVHAIEQIVGRDASELQKLAIFYNMQRCNWLVVDECKEARGGHYA